MTIKFNEVTWYSKLGAVILFLLVVPALTFYIGVRYQETLSVLNPAGNKAFVQKINTVTSMPATGSFTDPLNGAYVIDDEIVTFVGGKAEEEVAPGSAAQIETSIFGKPVYVDLNRDGQKDAVFFVAQETGGTGIFFYVAAAVNQGGKYVGTHAIFLGDRIAPQNITAVDDVAAINYADRGEGDAMASQPSVGVTKYVTIKDRELVETDVIVSE